MAGRSPRELIELYWEEVWNKGNVELIREICGDPMTRHTAGPIERLSHDQQIARLGTILKLRPRFTHEVLVADGTYASSVWNMRSEAEKYPFMSGIETFKVEAGRLTECWNPPYAFALWDGEE